MMRSMVQWIVALTVSVLLMGFVLAGAARAQTPAPVVTGDWHGVLTIPTGELRLGVGITAKPGGGLTGALSSPDQGPGEFPLDEVIVEGDHLKFTLKRINASFDGRWDAAKSAWVGTFTQGMGLPLTLTAGKTEALPAVAGLDGDWASTMTLPGGSRQRLILHVRTGAGGTIALMDLPDQLAYAIPVRPIARDGQKVTLAMKASNATFEGVLSADGKTLEGTWSGQAYKGPVTFTSRAVQTAAPRRPQTPKPPFPYRTEEVSVDSAPGQGSRISVYLPVAADAELATLAEAAADDDFAVDTAAQVAWLRTRSDINPARIGLIGHSEGGLVAPKVAVRDPKVAFIVLMAGPGVPLSEVLREQRRILSPAMGATPEIIRRTEALTDHVYAAIRDAKDDADAEARALKVIKAEAGDLLAQPGQAEMTAKQLASGWMRALVNYDPRPTLAKVKCPILALNGSKDGQVPPGQNLPAIRGATRANRDVTIVELPNLNHLFQTARTGAVGEYADIEETVAPIALDTMSDWIRKHVTKGAGR